MTSMPSRDNRSSSGDAARDHRKGSLPFLWSREQQKGETPLSVVPLRGTAAVDTAAAGDLAYARRWARIGMLAALALVLGYIEMFIPLPVPVPGIKLGLANVAVLMALELLDVKSAAWVALVKVLASGFLFGNPVMMLYSAAGTVLAFAAMAALTRIEGLSVVLAAMAGAILHNIGQLAVAALILGTPLVWATAPVLVIAACITGALSGWATRYALACLGDPSMAKAG